MEHIVRFLDDPHSSRAREIRWTAAGSLERAIAIAMAEWPLLRTQHGPRAGFVIEDRSARRVMIMPPGS